MDGLVPNSDELHRRYDQSVSMVAGLDPVLAFERRSKDLIRPFQKWGIAVSTTSMLLSNLLDPNEMAWSGLPTLPIL
jgi:hypothetical protein